MTDANNIWKNSSAAGKELPDDQLLAYMEGRLSGDALREVEEWLSTTGMESDAIEGLQAMNSSEAMEMTAQLNHQLQRSLKKKRRQRRGLGDQKWSWIAICVVLLLAIMAFLVIYLARQ